MVPLGLTTAESATDIAVQKNICGSGMTTRIISNKGMKDIMEIVRYFEKSGLLNNNLVSKTTENEAKEQKDGLLGMLMVTLVASLL